MTGFGKLLSVLVTSDSVRQTFFN